MNISHSQQVMIAKTFPFKCQSSPLKYPRIRFPADLGELYRLNSVQLIKAIRKDLTGWSQDSFNWFGRNGILKMNFVPRLLYVMQTVLCAVPGGVLQNHDIMRDRFSRPSNLLYGNTS